MSFARTVVRPLVPILAVSFASPALARNRSSSRSPQPPASTPVAPPQVDAPVIEKTQPAPNLTTPAVAPAPAAPRFTRVMVSTLKRDPEVPEKVASFVAQALVQELRKLERMQVTSAADVDEMLSFEEQKRLVGCTDEVCLSEIVSAMGVDQLVNGSLSSTPKSHILTLTRLDVTQAKTLATVTRELEKKDGEEFLAAIGPAVESLFADATLKPGFTRGVSREVARRLNPPPLPRWSFFSALAVSAAVAGGGTVAALASKDAEQQYNTLAAQALTSPVNGAQLVQLGNTATSRAHTANTLFIASGGVALAAGVMAFFVDWSPSTEPAGGLRPNRVAIAPGQNSGHLALAWDLP